jgi:hypothetical protein
MSEINSFLNQLVFWSMGYGSLMGFTYCPILMLQTNSWTMRLILLGFSVPVSALLVTAGSVCVYGYGMFLKYIGTVLSHPFFLHSMLNTISLSLSVFTAYVLYTRYYDMITQDGEANSKSVAEESEGSEEAEESEGSEGSEEAEESEGSDGSEEAEESEGSEEAEESEGSEEAEAKTEPNNSEWRKTANFEGLRTASPLPE